MQRIDALEERYAIGEIDKELYLKFISKYRKEKLDISTEMDTLNFENSNLEKRVEKYCQILGNLPDLWASNGYCIFSSKCTSHSYQSVPPILGQN